MKTVLARALVVFFLFATATVIAYYWFYGNPSLPVIQPSDINPKLVDEGLQNVQKDHTIGHFKLTNQFEKTVTPADFEGKIYVANFIFTTCPGICPIMTSNLRTVYLKHEDKTDLAFISHTVTPAIDTPPVLRAFAKNKGVLSEKWHFVTGDKRQIYRLARKDYFAATTEGDGGVDDFVHSENLVLVDKQKRIRGIYDGTSFDDIDKLIEDIEVLLSEYED